MFNALPILILAMGPVLAYLAGLIVFSGVRVIVHRLSHPNSLLP